MNTRILLFLSFLSLSLFLDAQENNDSLNIYIKNLQFQKALQWIDGQEESKQNQFQKAMCYNALGENRKATAILEELSEKYPFDISIKKELAQCYEVAAKWQSSSRVYSELIEIDSTNIYYPIKRAESDINNKNIDAAIDGLKMILQKDTLSTVLRLLGKSYETNNELDSAALYYTWGWARDSTDVFFATNFVNVLLKNKQYQQANLSAQIYIEKDSTSGQMNFLYGYSQYALEDYESAKETLQKCYNAGDSLLSVSRTLGMSYFFMGESDNSYKYLLRAYEQDTTNNTVLQHLAESVSDIKKYDEGVIYFTKILERLVPSKMKLYLNYRRLAMAYEKLEKYSQAAQCYEKAMESATQDQTFFMLEPLAHIYYEYLDNKVEGLYYYKQYRTTLDGKLLYYKHTPPEEDHVKEIEDFTKQLAEVDEFIRQAESELYKDRQTPQPIYENPNLFIVNNEVVDFPPQGKFNHVKTIYNLDKATEEELCYVELAKEKNKTTIIIIDADIDIEEEKEVEKVDTPAIAKDSLQAINQSTTTD